MNEKLILKLFTVADAILPIPRGIPILLYHAVNDRTPRLSVKIGEFQRQMEFLYKSGYKTAPLSSLFKEKGKKQIAITFDDGFKDNLTNAMPIMKRYGFAGSVFISTDFIGRKSEFAKEGARDHEMLSQNDIKALHDAGWEICNHFAGHKDLDILSDDEIRKEYARAVDRLKEIIGEQESLKIVSYPHNKKNEHIKVVLKEFGVKMALAGRGVSAMAEDDLYELPRVEISRDIIFSKYKLTLSPTFNRLKRLVR